MAAQSPVVGADTEPDERYGPHDAASCLVVRDDQASRPGH